MERNAHSSMLCLRREALTTSSRVRLSLAIIIFSCHHLPYLVTCISPVGAALAPVLGDPSPIGNISAIKVDGVRRAYGAAVAHPTLHSGIESNNQGEQDLPVVFHSWG